MKYPCGIIRDLLPLYHDRVCSSESVRTVEEHIAECAQCREALRMLEEGSASEIVPDEEKKKAERFKGLKIILQRKMIKKAAIAASITAAAFLAALLLLNLTLTEPVSVIKDVRVENGLLSVSAEKAEEFIFMPDTENRDGMGTPILIITAKSTLAHRLSVFFGKDMYESVPFTYPLTSEAWHNSFGEDFEMLKADLEKNNAWPEDDEYIELSFGSKSMLPWGDIEKVYYNCGPNVPSGRLDETCDGLILLWESGA